MRNTAEKNLSAMSVKWSSKELANPRALSVIYDGEPITSSLLYLPIIWGWQVYLLFFDDQHVKFIEGQVTEAGASGSDFFLSFGRKGITPPQFFMMILPLTIRILYFSSFVLVFLFCCFSYEIPAVKAGKKTRRFDFCAGESRPSLLRSDTFLKENYIRRKAAYAWMMPRCLLIGMGTELSEKMLNNKGLNGQWR